MRQIALICRSSGAGARGACRVLDQYARRSGDRTWTTTLSEAGLAAVRLALQSSATRNTSVMALSVEGGRFKVRWFVGRRARFGPDGDCPVSTSRRGHASLSERAQFKLAPLLVDLVHLSGLGHDVGKHIAGEQRKMKSDSHETSPIRHEVLSTLILAGEKLPLPAGALLPRAPATADELVLRMVYSHHRLEPEAEGDGKLCERTIPGVLLGHPAFTPLHLDEQMRHIAMTPLLGPEALDAMFLWGRLALMLADHFVSARRLRLGASGLLANSAKPGRPPQDLVVHGEEVARLARRLVPLLTSLDVRLRGLQSEDLSAARRQSRGDFAWQNGARKQAASVKRGQNAIVFLAAGTGSGKTVAGYSVLAALRPNGPHRVSVALGLRSLTLQTGRVYREQLGLDLFSCLTLIGSSAVSDIHRTLSGDAPTMPQMESGGTPVAESSDHDPDAKKVDLLGVLYAEAKTDDLKKMLDTPVLVSTVDYLMAAADWRRARHLWAALRVMSSDLIIDEIDDYSPRDIVALSRLVWLAGANGRNVVVSSATLAPELAKALADAFASGQARWQAMTGAPEAAAICASNLMAAETMSLAPAERAHTAAGIVKYLHGLGEASLAAAQGRALRKGKIIKLPRSAKRIADILIEEAISMCAEHHEERDGLRLSFALARFARTKHAARIAECVLARIAAMNLPVAIKVILYHSKIPLAVKGILEADLDQALSRKKGCDIFESRLARPVLDEMEVRGLSAGIVLVVATPITEVGRDHDYDIAFIEPSSARSIIQCVGRVNRHRRKTVLTPNVVVFAENLEGSFRCPGFEIEGFSFDGLRDLAVSASGFCALPTTADILLDRSDPRVCAFARREREVIEGVISDGIRNFAHDREQIYRDGHFAAYCFRRDTLDEDSTSQAVYYCLQRSGWFEVRDTDSPMGDVALAEKVGRIGGGAWLYDHETMLARVIELAGFTGLSLDSPDGLARWSRRHMLVEAIADKATHADIISGLWASGENLAE